MVIRRPSGKGSTARIVPVTMLAWVGRSTSIGGARAVAIWAEVKPRAAAARGAISQRNPGRPTASPIAGRAAAAPTQGAGSNRSV